MYTVKDVSLSHARSGGYRIRTQLCVFYLKHHRHVFLSNVTKDNVITGGKALGPTLRDRGSSSNYANYGTGAVRPALYAPGFSFSICFMEMSVPAPPISKRSARCQKMGGLATI